VCTVVVRRAEGRPAQILALRDELTTREFDDPGRWWPEYPDVVGGRDRSAGGTWCATHVGTGATALVVNRPQKAVADPGAPSRGVLPLLAAQHGSPWVGRIDVSGMAGFALMLVTPRRVTTWDFDGEQLIAAEQPAGTSMLTSGGPENRKADIHLHRFAEARYPDGWRRLVQGRPPTDDPAALVVRHEQDGLVFGTVFGELIEAEPGRLRLEYSRRPWEAGPWRIQETEGPAATPSA
jgi:Transport and Golgi organisation 2